MANTLHRHLRLTCLWALCVLLAGCYEGTETSSQTQLVVEGWIDAGGFPVVKLTKTIHFGKNEAIELDSLSKYVERWAKVSISDGERTEIMVGRYDSRYFPPFIYTSYEMRGEAGKEYSLKVETPDGLVAEAKTTIPQPASVDSFRIEPTETDTLFQLYAYTSCRRRCKFFAKVENENTEYLSSVLGLLDTGMIPADGKVSVRRGRSNMLKDNNQFFKSGETVWVKFSTLDDASYDYWRSFEDMIGLSRVPLVAVNTNLKSNVKGALGYWCGYGSTYYKVTIGAPSSSSDTMRADTTLPTISHAKIAD